MTALCLSVGASGPPLWAQPDLPNKAAEQVQAQKVQIEKAKALIAAGKLEPAAEALLKFINAAPQSPFVPEAYLLLGQIETDQQHPDEALAYYRLLLEEFPSSEFAPQARLRLALGLMKAGRPEDALTPLLEAKDQAPDPAFKLTVLQHLEELYLAKRDYVRAVESILETRALSGDDTRLLLEQRVRDLVRSLRGEQDLRRIADRYPTAFPGDAALLRLLDLQLAGGESYKAARTAREFFRRFPLHEQIGVVSRMLGDHRQQLKAKSLLIGALLPLSGPLSPYGDEVLNGIRMAFDEMVAEGGLQSVGLVVKDTAGDPKELTLELDDLLGDFRPLAVIGPLLTREVKAVAAAADSHEVVFVTPTATAPDVQRTSRYLFNTSVNNRALVQELAAYATGPMRWKRFCVLYPRDPYGAEMSQIFIEEVRRLGGEIIATETYAPDDKDFGPSIKRIKEADLKREGKLEPGPKKAGKDTKVYTPGFDAVFLPGEAEQVGLIAGQLAFYAAKVPILGTNGMNSPDLIRIGDRAVEGAIFADSFFVDSPDLAVRNFAEGYMKRYQTPPSAFAAQAYEATRLVLEAVRRGATSGRALRDSLKNTRNVAGLSGTITMSPAGYLERRYELIQVKGGKFVPVTTSG